MSWFSQMLGTSRHTGPIMGQINSQIGDLRSGQGANQAFQDTAGAFLNNAMPQFRQNLQLTREDAQRRGVSTGDLGTSMEGDLTSAFQRNIANALAGQSTSLYMGRMGMVNDLLGGELGAQSSQDNSNRNFWSSLLGSGMMAAAMA